MKIELNRTAARRIGLIQWMRANGYRMQPLVSCGGYIVTHRSNDMQPISMAWGAAKTDSGRAGELMWAVAMLAAHSGTNPSDLLASLETA